MEHLLSLKMLDLLRIGCTVTLPNGWYMAGNAEEKEVEIGTARDGAVGTCQLKTEAILAFFAVRKERGADCSKSQCSDDTILAHSLKVGGN